MLHIHSRTLRKQTIAVILQVIFNIPVVMCLNELHAARNIKHLSAADSDVNTSTITLSDADHKPRHVLSVGVESRATSCATSTFCKHEFI